MWLRKMCEHQPIDFVKSGFHRYYQLGPSPVQAQPSFPNVCGRSPRYATLLLSRLSSMSWRPQTLPRFSSTFPQALVRVQLLGSRFPVYFVLPCCWAGFSTTLTVLNLQAWCSTASTLTYCLADVVNKIAWKVHDIHSFLVIECSQLQHTSYYLLNSCGELQVRSSIYRLVLKLTTTMRLFRQFGYEYSTKIWNSLPSFNTPTGASRVGMTRTKG